MFGRRKPPLPRRQFAVLPYRRRANGTVEVLLVTSRETRRWLVPKGWPVHGMEPHRSAEQEALEEAGVVGAIETEPIGRYHYDKRLKSGRVVPCVVEVYRLAVERENEDWLERGERTRQWFSPEQAAALVQEPELRALIRSALPIEQK